MIRRILQQAIPEDAAVLARVSPPAPEDGLVRGLVRDLWDTLRSTSGIGLSAPQIGVSQRVAVVLPDIELINPTITWKSYVRSGGWEGCLSLAPDLLIYVERPTVVVVSAWGVRGSYTFTDLTARVVQHELDHLDGRLITG